MRQLEIIIPAKNEAENVAELAKRIHAAMKNSGIDYGMIFVDDRSTDDTAKIVKELSKKYPVTLHKKLGKPGKAYAILEASRIATAPVLAMIDADLQYPPEKIIEMYEKLQENVGVVVANRSSHDTNRLRKIGSRVNKFVFGRVLLGLACDTQSGLKLFRREIINHLDELDVTAWTLDMPLLHTAKELGYKIDSVDIHFAERSSGESKVRFLKVSTEIAARAIKLRLKKKKVYTIAPHSASSALGAGIVHKKKRFVTHTNLSHHQSALKTFYPWQKAAFFIVVAAIITGFVVSAKTTAIALVAILSFIYFADVIFSLYVLLKSLHFPPELQFNDDEIGALSDDDLPVYSILCPLYKEAAVLPLFLDALETLDWPKDKLDALLLLEENDQETQDAAAALDLPSYVRVVVVPDSQPKTKPKACNYGLHFAKGEYVVIYDAEDRPDPAQLKKAYLGFLKLGKKYFCLQSKLNYFNVNHNLLTRLFTAEYSLWFDLILPGLQSIEATIPLGGTSNHFRTKDLIEMNAWDPFNVTEDCDLGVRLFKAGYKTAIIDSVTLEEANSNPKNWVRQRSRWIKGYVQTYFVHMRNPIQFIREHKFQALIFQLIIGMRMTFILINPILWSLTAAYFILYRFIGPQIEAIYPSAVFYTAVTSLILGNFMYLYTYMIGSAKRGHWGVIKYIFFIPFYWLLMSIAAAIGFYQLIVKPHYWEKTNHGLHLKKKQKSPEAKAVETKVNRFLNSKALQNREFIGGSALVASAMIANVVNFLYSTYLTHVTGYEEFGLISLIGSILNLSQIPLSSFSRSVVHKSARLLGKYGEPVKPFWASLRRKTYIISILLLVLWVVSIPLMARFFNSSDYMPFIIFSPIWFIGTIGAVDTGFLSGSMQFSVVALMVVVEVITKFAATLFFVNMGYPQYIYAAFPISVALSFLVGWISVLRVRSNVVVTEENDLSFPRKFFASSILTKISGVAFLSADLILAKHYLSPTLAGQYAVLSLAGKMVYFLGTIFNQFIVPYVSKNEGSGKSSITLFNRVVLATTAATMSGFVAFGLFGFVTLPYLYGSKILPVVDSLPSYTFAMGAFAIAGSIVSFYQSRQKHQFAYASLIASFVMIGAIMLNHDNIAQIANMFSITTVGYLVAVVIMHFAFVFFKEKKTSPNDGDRIENSDRLKILLLNWRDTKHIWAGGAETYVHELAKRWVANGHHVTVFCGNDQKSARNEVVDGVQIVRRGGFYTVYFWAWVYYVLRFRGNFDLVVESENGAPFFTPLYVGKPKFLLVHHVHQEVFRDQLSWPLSFIARFIESKMLPILYRNQNIVTVSESSKRDIISLGVGKSDTIDIITPGVDVNQYRRGKKTSYPSMIYIGRLKPYKNIDIAIKAFAKIVEKYPTAKFFIAGDGDSQNDLWRLSRELKLKKSIVFLGKVTEEDKVRYLSKSWMAIQPSSFEGWGITVIEANASGTPVIASNVNGLKDSVVDGKTGLLVRARDVDAFVEAITTLIDDPEYRLQMSQEAYLWATRFSWDRASQYFMDSIKKAIKNKSNVSASTQLVFEG